MQAETTAALPGLTFDGICVATFAATQLAFCIGALHIAESTLNGVQTVHFGESLFESFRYHSIHFISV